MKYKLLQRFQIPFWLLLPILRYAHKAANVEQRGHKDKVSVSRIIWNIQNGK